MKQQQQQPQDEPQQTCIRCGGQLFFRTPILDPTTNRTFQMFRCKNCDNQQWTSEPLT